MCIDNEYIRLRIPSKLEAMGCLKGKSVLRRFDDKLNLRRRPGRDRTLWARGYYDSTVVLDGLMNSSVHKESGGDRQFGIE